ncbi:MAG: PIN domain-containing protein [Candidatus Altiarchaeota archaeon]
MTDEAYFFDSYAIIEVLKGSEGYKRYVESRIITTKLNLYEVYYSLLKLSEEKADTFLRDYGGYSVPFDSEIIRMAAQLKRLKTDLSMADTIGYVTALKNGIKFLTGDKEFKGLDNV